MKLKEDYRKVEQRERRRLKKLKIANEKGRNSLGEVRSDFDQFESDFDLEMDHLANKADF